MCAAEQGCVAGGSVEIYHEIKKLIEESGLNCEVSLDSDACKSSVGLKKSGCPRLLRNGSGAQNRAVKAVLPQGKA